jgi:hypothetical protein
LCGLCPRLSPWKSYLLSSNSHYILPKIPEISALNNTTISSSLFIFRSLVVMISACQGLHWFSVRGRPGFDSVRISLHALQIIDPNGPQRRESFYSTIMFFSCFFFWNSRGGQDLSTPFCGEISAQNPIYVTLNIFFVLSVLVEQLSSGGYHYSTLCSNLFST